MMRTSVLPLSVALLSACADADLQGSDEIDPVEPCGVSIVETLPANGSTDAYYRQAVEFHLSAPDTTARAWADFDGVQTVSEDGLTIRYTPLEPLGPRTVHTAGLEFCSGSPEIVFTTSELGEPLVEDVDLVGRTYAVDLEGARFLAGEGLEDIAASLLSPRVLFSVVAVEGGRVSLRVALPEESEPWNQDFCARTFDLDGVDFSGSPYFEVEMDDLAFYAYEGTVDLEHLGLTGTVSPDATRIGGATFTAVVDVRDIVAILGASEAETICAIAESLDLACEPCPSDAAPYCVTIEVDHIEAEYVEGLALEKIDAIDDRCEG